MQVVGWKYGEKIQFVILAVPDLGVVFFFEMATVQAKSVN